MVIISIFLRSNLIPPLGKYVYDEILNDVTFNKVLLMS